MASDISADGTSNGGADVVARLSQMSNRTNLMVIDATLRALARAEGGYAPTHNEIRVIARRMLHATQDFAATLAPQTHGTN